MSRQFVINEFLSLKLENGKTYIYIKGKRFIQCIRLFLQIPQEESNLYESVDSIDEATEVFNRYLYDNRIIGPNETDSIGEYDYSFTPEEEFWGHCSNLQTWAEHDYDTRIMHSNLAFQLLKTLAYAGDPKAKFKFKEEIAIRFESGYFSVVVYLLEQGYLLFLDEEELKALLENNLEKENGLLEKAIEGRESILPWYALLYLRIKNYTRAITLLKRSLEVNPELFHAHFLLGIGYGLLEDHPRAYRSFVKALNKTPNNELVWYGFVLSIICADEYEKILDLFVSALKSRITPEDMHQTIFDEFLRLKNEDSRFILTLIEYGYTLLLNLEELEDLFYDIDKIPEPLVKTETSLASYGLISFLIGDPTKAVQYLEELLDLSENDLIRQKTVLIILGISYGSLNQHEKAMQLFRRLLDMDEKNDLAWFGLGISYAQSKDYKKLFKLLYVKEPLNLLSSQISKKWYDKTIKGINLALSRNYKNGMAHKDLGTVYYNFWIRGKSNYDLRSAFYFFLDAIRYGVSDKETWYKLGTCYLNLNQKKNAKDAFKHVKKLDKYYKNTISLLKSLKKK
jgi:tetratricopeptide (TPR) repeat protein